MLKRSIVTILIFLPVLIGTSAFSLPRYKTVEISGLKIFSERFLADQLLLKRIRAGKRRYFRSVAKDINAFYHRRGYLLANTQLVEETDTTLKVFVDEGHISKIIFYNLNSIDTLKIRYEFKLRKKIYNKYAVERETIRLKKKYEFIQMYPTLKLVKSYDSSLLQLDRKLDLPLLGKTGLPFFSPYKNEYNLEIFIVKPSLERSGGLTYGIKTSYSKGFMPYIQYFYPNFLLENDLWENRISVGIFYGFDLQYKNPPHWTYMEYETNYHFPPTLKEYFTPKVNGLVYRSWSSRADIGLLQYEYLKLRGALYPGLTILQKLKIHAGYGGEKVYIYNSKIDTEAPYQVDIKEHIEYWNFIEGIIRFDFFPWTLKRNIERHFELIYDYYMNDTTFHKLKFNGLFQFEFKNFDIYSLEMEYEKIWHRPPFYYDIPVEDSAFKGLGGKSYHTFNTIRLSNEYKISLYRDWILGGIFLDYTWFEGSGYDLTGNQHAIVSGPAGHFIFLDQFEMDIFFGKDYLFSTGDSQYNLKFNARKKW